MILKRFLAVFALFLLGTNTTEAYRALTDNENGGNPKLSTKTYKVYIQGDPTSNNRNQEVKEALEKWKNELSGKGITLEVQAGNPPQQPFDLKKYNEEVKKFNETENPNPAEFPEIQKFEAKKCTISVYWETTAEIGKRGGGSERGFTFNTWSFNDKGKADKIDFSDVFLPTDPPGASEEIKKRIIHNISIHEFGHVTGLDHYTEEQDKTGQVMETDATLHSEKLPLGDEEKKGLDAIYGQKPKLKIDSKAENKEGSFLPPHIQDHLPDGIRDVWEYTYNVQWLEGVEVSYFQIEAGRAPIFFALGLNGLEDWKVDSLDENDLYLEFIANSVYLGPQLTSGTLRFFTDVPPGEGWLVYSGDAAKGVAPVPEPVSLSLVGLGFLLMMQRRRI